MAEVTSLAEAVREAVVRLEAAEVWFGYCDSGRCDPSEGHECARALVTQAEAWLAKVSVE
jgi:hypothetical protein